MGSCEQELLQYKLRELFCKDKCDCCDVCVVDCCDNKKKDCDYCDCCVKPLKDLLEQFTPGDPIAVFTDDGMAYGQQYATAFFVSVNGSILTIRVEYDDSQYIEKISICHIVKVYSFDIEDADLLKLECEPNKGYCKCCAKDMNNQLKAYTGLYVEYIYLEGYWTEYGIITEVSDGIAIIDGFIAIPVCKVTNVELPVNVMPGLKAEPHKKIEKTEDGKKLFEKGRK